LPIPQNFFFPFNSLKTVDLKNGMKWHSVVPEPTNKLAFKTFRHDYFKEVKLAINRIQPSTTLLEENVKTVPYFVILPDKQPYMRMFNLKIDHLISSGLTQKWYDEYMLLDKNAKQYVEEIEPQVLKVETLRLGFYAYIIALTFSVAAFALEFLFVQLKLLLEIGVAKVITSCPLWFMS
jgi:hypothetical protein